MKIDQISLYRLTLKFRQPFKTSFGCFQARETILVEIESNGVSGWGEAAVLPFPFYNHEDSITVLHILQRYLCPEVLEKQPQDIDSLSTILNKVVGNNIAKAGIELAFWDLIAKTEDKPLYKMLGGIRRNIECGAVVSESEDINSIFTSVGECLDQGYKRVKLKISPGNDLNLINSLTSEYPGQRFVLDANTAYTLKDSSLFKKLDEFNLLMIEEPISKGNFVEYAELQSKLKTTICLDESIESINDAATAIKLGSCRAISIKPARVGGLKTARAIHDLAAASNIGVWCGGMLETGIGKLHNMALASLPNFIYPGDFSETCRYFESDIVEPQISFSTPGILSLSDNPGIGAYILKSEIESRSNFRLIFK